MTFQNQGYNLYKVVATTDAPTPYSEVVFTSNKLSEVAEWLQKAEARKFWQQEASCWEVTYRIDIFVGGAARYVKIEGVIEK